MLSLGGLPFPAVDRIRGRERTQLAEHLHVRLYGSPTREVVRGHLVLAGRAAVESGDADDAENLSAWVAHAMARQAEHDRRLRAIDGFLADSEARARRDHEDQLGKATRRARASTIVVRGRRGVACPSSWVAGALLAVERGDRDVAALVKRERLAGAVPVTHGGVIGQVWRGGGRANLARLVAGLSVVALDEHLGRRSGRLWARSGTSDVIDAALVLLAHDGDEIATSDAGDRVDLAAHADLQVDLLPV